MRRRPPTTTLNDSPFPNPYICRSRDYKPFTPSWRLIGATMHSPRLFLSICAISFFWTIGAVLIIIFPPLVKYLLTADERVASLVIAIFSVGIAIGSIVINTKIGRAHV